MSVRLQGRMYVFCILHTCKCMNLLSCFIHMHFSDYSLISNAGVFIICLFCSETIDISELVTSAVILCNNVCLIALLSLTLSLHLLSHCCHCQFAVSVCDLRHGIGCIHSGTLCLLSM